MLFRAANWVEIGSERYGSDWFAWSSQSNVVRSRYRTQQYNESSQSAWHALTRFQRWHGILAPRPLRTSVLTPEPNESVIIVINGSAIHSERDLHDFLKAQLQLGDFYGCNSAALWDRLTTDVERPVHIVWEDSESSRIALGDATFSKYVKLFNDVADQDAEYGWDDRFLFTRK